MPSLRAAPDGIGTAGMVRSDQTVYAYRSNCVVRTHLIPERFGRIRRTRSARTIGWRLDLSYWKCRMAYMFFGECGSKRRFPQGRITGTRSRYAKSEFVHCKIALKEIT
jgi:hypothetical protein